MFFLLALGFGCLKKGMFSRQTGQELSNFVVTAVTMALLLDAYTGSTFEPGTARNMAVALVLSIGILLLGAGIAKAVRLGKGKKLTGIERYGVIFPNSAYMGIPIVAAVAGKTGVLYASSFILAFNIISWTLGIRIIAGDRAQASLKKTLLSPVMVTIYASILLYVTGIRFPAPIAAAVGYVASLMTPLTMIVSGVLMAQTPLKQMLSDKRVYAVSALRLLAVPLVVLLVLAVLPFDRQMETSLLILSSAPCGASVLLFAAKFDVDAEHAGGLFSVSTLCSIVTMPLISMAAQGCWSLLPFP